MASQRSDEEGLKEPLREKEDLEKPKTELQRVSTSTSDAVEKIKDGFNSFLTNLYYPQKAHFDKLATGQSPKFLVFACSDSRVSPTTILNFQPGEAFMVRNIASIVPTFDQVKYTGTGAIIEYAVHKLGVENILVIGHSNCGGIARLMSHPEDGTEKLDFVDDWVNICLPAKTKVIAEGGTNADCSKEAVNLSLRNLQTYPYVQKAVSEKKLAMRGGYYDFVNGIFELWGLQSNNITPSIFIPRPSP